jgi:hypothetical protein
VSLKLHNKLSLNGIFIMARHAIQATSSADFLTVSSSIKISLGYSYGNLCSET